MERIMSTQRMYTLDEFLTKIDQKLSPEGRAHVEKTLESFPFEHRGPSGEFYTETLWVALNTYMHED